MFYCEEMVEVFFWGGGYKDIWKIKWYDEHKASELLLYNMHPSFINLCTK